MIRHQTSYWLTLVSDVPGTDPDERAVAAAVAALAPFDIIPSPDGPVPGTAIFEVDPEYGTIEYTDSVHEAIGELAKAWPGTTFHLEELDEEDKSVQIATLFRHGKILTSHASVEGPRSMADMVLRADDPEEAARQDFQARVRAVAKDLKAVISDIKSESSARALRNCLDHIKLAAAALEGR